MLKSGFLLVGIAALLFLCACGGQGRFSGNADKLLQAYLEKIEAEVAKLRGEKATKASAKKPAAKTAAKKAPAKKTTKAEPTEEKKD